MKKLSQGVGGYVGTKFSCLVCLARWEMEQSDFKYIMDTRRDIRGNPESYEIRCPDCGELTWVQREVNLVIS